MPISIHIPQTLTSLAITPKSFLEKHPSYSRLVVGACIFSLSDETPSSTPRVLLVQRAVTEYAYPSCWEIPGGSCEADDPTILHSTAREVFEETGLHLTRVIRKIGDGMSFTSGPEHNLKHWLKLTFEVEVLEAVQSSPTGK